MKSDREIAVLCAARRSVYKKISGLNVFDVERDARTFQGGMPVIAHPPCRLWSAYCSHQAKSIDPDSEKALGVFCVNMVIKCGGVLEQPAHSRLWDACGIPKPMKVHTDQSWSIEILQYWFGDERRKTTWLYFSGIEKKDVPQMPFRLSAEGRDRRIWQLMSSKNQREATPKLFAEWLVSCARLCKFFHIPETTLDTGISGKHKAPGCGNIMNIKPYNHGIYPKETL